MLRTYYIWRNLRLHTTTAMNKDTKRIVMVPVDTITAINVLKYRKQTNRNSIVIQSASLTVSRISISKLCFKGNHGLNRQKGNIFTNNLK